MKNKYLMAMVLCFCMLGANAQFFDDMEWPAGNCPAHWGGGPPFGCPPIGVGNAHSGVQYGYIPDDGTTDVVLDLGSKVAGEWGLKFWMFVPLGKEAYWNLQGEYPVGAGQWIVGNIYFNRDNTSPGVGEIDDTALGSVMFAFPHDEWFEIIINVDISSGINASTWQFYADGVEAVPAGTPFTNGSGTYPTSLGGVDFFSINSNNQLYIDTFDYINGFHTPSLGIDDVSAVVFSVVPNPVANFLRIHSQEDIISLKVYNIIGRQVMESNNSDIMDVSLLADGIYVIEVTTPKGIGLQKFIKK